MTHLRSDMATQAEVMGPVGTKSRVFHYGGCPEVGATAASLLPI
ncbi:MAG TPA: hypothetical protein VJU61_25540 [Polyangiaceae bacterium]|nr:hypothetical protein [Polyangiaceae bacterium]